MAIMSKEVLFSDGEQLEPSDLNNVQRFLYSLIGDGIVGCAAPQLDLSEPAGMLITHLYAVGVSGAPHENGTGTRTPNFLAGLVAQRISAAAVDGDDSQVLFYYLVADEPSVARPAATVNPRWDVVSILLARANGDSQSRDFQDASTRALSTSAFNKQRAVSATITWTTGTEAASPVEPAIPAGHVKLAAFRVVPAVTLFDPTTDIRDYRMPIGGRSEYSVIGTSWAYGSLWTPNTNGALVSPSGIGTSTDASCPCPRASSGARLLSVGYGGGRGANFDAATVLVVSRVADASSAQTDLLDVSAILPAAPSTSAFTSMDMTTPIWGNGFEAGYACERDGNRTTLGLRLNLANAESGGSGFTISSGRFVLVG
jgi:hypothetical protein